MKRITKLKPNQIFTFGSNAKGIHGAGAALDARRLFGAQLGVGSGITCQCYAIPTKDFKLKTLSLPAIKVAVDQFIWYAKGSPELEFVVTQIGCGLAGYKHEQIAPMFKDAPKNCIMSDEWKEFLCA